MKLKIIGTTNTENGSRDLPMQFHEPVREDLIARAVRVVLSNKRQPYGTDPEAGMKQATKLSRRRKDWKASYGHGISRVPRKTMSRNGTRFNWTAALAPMTVGGRVAHPPKAAKVWTQKINKTERRKAIRSALAATMKSDLIIKRGHLIPSQYPFILDNHFEQLQKTKDVLAALRTIGFEEELNRVEKTHVRAGRGKTRGRKYKKVRGVLLVVSTPCPLMKAAENIPGLEIALVHKLNCELLAPGTHIGRLTLFTQSAVDAIEKEHLFTNSVLKQAASPAQNKAEEKKQEKTSEKKTEEKKAELTIQKTVKKTEEKKKKEEEKTNAAKEKQTRLM